VTIKLYCIYFSNIIIYGNKKWFWTCSDSALANMSKSFFTLVKSVRETYYGLKDITLHDKKQYCSTTTRHVMIIKIWDIWVRSLTILKLWLFFLSKKKLWHVIIISSVKTYACVVVSDFSPVNRSIVFRWCYVNCKFSQWIIQNTTYFCK
jgi:hypothetical protein